MKMFLVDRPVKKPLAFTTRCEKCGRYYDELAERVLELLGDAEGVFLCIECDPSAEAERINLLDRDGAGE